MARSLLRVMAGGVVRSTLAVAVEADWAQRATGLLQGLQRHATRPARLGLLFFPLLLLLVWGTRLSPWTLASFSAGVCGFFLLPGYAIARAAKLRCGGDELLALSLALGLCASNVAFTLAAWARLPASYWILPLVSAAYACSRLLRRAEVPVVARFTLATTPAAWLVAALPVFMLTRVSVHALDFVRDSGGVHLVGWADGTLHASIAHELTHTFPPRNPFLGDQPLVYHYATELSAAVFCKFLHLPATDVCLRLMPTLFLSLAVLSAFALLKRLTRSSAAAAITPLFMLLGEDFSWLPALWKGSTGVWAAEYFGSPSVFGLYFANPNLPGLAAFMCALLALSHALRGSRPRMAWVAITAITLALAGSYKIFFGIQALAALVACAVLCRGARRGFMLRLLAATALALGILLCPTLLTHSGSKVVELAPTFFTGYASAMLGALGVGDSSWLAAFGRMFASKQLSLAGLSQWLFIALPLFVAGTLGARLLGLARLLRALVKPSSEPAALHFVGWFVVCGYALGLCLRVTPIDEPGGYNNSVWFIVESKLVAWTFAGVALGTLFRTWSPAHAAWTAALLVGLLAVPSTANTFAALDRTTSPSVATRDEAEVAAFFAHEAAPGAVVLCESSNLKRLLLGEAGMRVPFAQEFYLSSFLRRTSLDARAKNLNQFWQAWATGTFRGDLAAKYGTDYVVSTRRHAGSPPIFERATLFVYPTAALHAR